MINFRVYALWDCKSTQWWSLRKLISIISSCVQKAKVVVIHISFSSGADLWNPMHSATRLADVVEDKMDVSVQIKNLPLNRLLWLIVLVALSSCLLVLVQAWFEFGEEAESSHFAKSFIILGCQSALLHALLDWGYLSWNLMACSLAFDELTGCVLGWAWVFCYLVLFESKQTDLVVQ